KDPSSTSVAQQAPVVGSIQHPTYPFDSSSGSPARNPAPADHRFRGGTKWATFAARAPVGPVNTSTARDARDDADHIAVPELRGFAPAITKIVFVQENIYIAPERTVLGVELTPQRRVALEQIRQRTPDRRRLDRDLRPTARERPERDREPNHHTHRSASFLPGEAWTAERRAGPYPAPIGPTRPHAGGRPSDQPEGPWPKTDPIAAPDPKSPRRPGRPSPRSSAPAAPRTCRPRPRATARPSRRTCTSRTRSSNGCAGSTATGSAADASTATGDRRRPVPASPET